MCVCVCVSEMVSAYVSKQDNVCVCVHIINTSW